MRAAVPAGHPRSSPEGAASAAGTRLTQRGARPSPPHRAAGFARVRSSRPETAPLHRQKFQPSLCGTDPKRARAAPPLPPDSRSPSCCARLPPSPGAAGRPGGCLPWSPAGRVGLRPHAPPPHTHAAGGEARVGTLCGRTRRCRPPPSGESPPRRPGSAASEGAHPPFCPVAAVPGVGGARPPCEGNGGHGGARPWGGGAGSAGRRAALQALRVRGGAAGGQQQADAGRPPAAPPWEPGGGRGSPFRAAGGAEPGSSAGREAPRRAGSLRRLPGWGRGWPQLPPTPPWRGSGGAARPAGKFGQAARRPGSPAAAGQRVAGGARCPAVPAVRAGGGGRAGREAFKWL